MALQFSVHERRASSSLSLFTLLTSMAFSLCSRDRPCREEEVELVDLWDSFVGKEDMYVRDGLHLSGKGAAVFAEGCQGRLPVAWVSTIFKLVGQGGLSKKAQKVQADSGCNRETHPKQKLNARSIINKKNELNIMVDDIKPHNNRYN